MSWARHRHPGSQHSQILAPPDGTTQAQRARASYPRPWRETHTAARDQRPRGVRDRFGLVCRRQIGPSLCRRECGTRSAEVHVPRRAGCGSLSVGRRNQLCAWARQKSRRIREDAAAWGQTAEAARRAMRESIELVARQAETAIRHDPAEAKDSAERLRALAKELVMTTPAAASPERREQPAPREHFSNSARASADKAARYKDLEDRLRLRDRATPKPREREDGRDRDH
jgi:hypothetical protein